MASLTLVRDLPGVCHRQGGAFTRAQAYCAGYSPDRVRRRLRQGLWVPVVGRALAISGAPRTPLMVAWAVHLTVPGGVVSHLTAAGVWRFPTPPGSTGRPTGHVITASHDRFEGILTHRVPLAAHEVRVHEDLPITSRRRTAIDCLALLPLDEAITLWAWLSTRGVLDIRDLATAAQGRLGRHGAPALVRVLAQVSSGALSPAERRMHRLLRSAGIRGWEANARVRARDGAPFVVDLLFARERLVIEVDGYAWHAGRDRFVLDRRRDNLLVAAGYTVLRVTWDDLRDRPGPLLEEIRSTLGRLRGMIAV
jgi:very-short-patch-repair endonuclease